MTMLRQINMTKYDKELLAYLTQVHRQFSYETLRHHQLPSSVALVSPGQHGTPKSKCHPVDMEWTYFGTLQNFILFHEQIHT